MGIDSKPTEAPVADTTEARSTATTETPVDDTTEAPSTTEGDKD